ncbi:hypothetical protein LINPERPRIM_LOCUS17702 [Linum perenne]
MLDIPSLIRSESLIRQVANNYFPALLSIDPTGLERNRWTRAVKVFVEVPAAEPLRTDCELEMDGGDTQKVSFKYEKIQPLCLYCGRLGHLMELCIWRREDMVNGLSGVSSGKYKPSLKVGVHSNSNSKESGSRRSMGSRNADGDGSSSRNSQAFAESDAHSPEIPQAGERILLPDSFSSTNSPEFFSPTLQMLFPEETQNNLIMSPLTPTNLFHGFEEVAHTDIHTSPMSPNLLTGPPGFPLREQMEREGPVPINGNFSSYWQNDSFTFSPNPNNISTPNHLNRGNPNLFGLSLNGEGRGSGIQQEIEKVRISNSNNKGKEPMWEPSGYGPSRLHLYLDPSSWGLSSKGMAPDQIFESLTNLSGWSSGHNVSDSWNRPMAEVLNSEGNPFRHPGPSPPTLPLLNNGNSTSKSGLARQMGMKGIHSPSMIWSPINHYPTNKEMPTKLMVWEGILSYKKRKVGEEAEGNMGLNIHSLSISPTSGPKA